MLLTSSAKAEPALEISAIAALEGFRTGKEEKQGGHKRTTSINVHAFVRGTSPTAVGPTDATFRTIPHDRIESRGRSGAVFSVGLLRQDGQGDLSRSGARSSAAVISFSAISGSPAEESPRPRCSIQAAGQSAASCHGASIQEGGQVSRLNRASTKCTDAAVGAMASAALGSS